MNFKAIPESTESAATAIVDSALAVHRVLGPGLLESVYEVCLAHELKLRNLEVCTQQRPPIIYKDCVLDAELRLDLVVSNCVIVEVKSVEDVHAIHDAQLLTYLKLTKHRLGLLINFNVPLIKNGIKRIVL